MTEDRTITLLDKRIKQFDNASLVPKASIFLLSPIKPIRTIIGVFALQHHFSAIHPNRISHWIFVH
jgi:hypothetical protein